MTSTDHRQQCRWQAAVIAVALASVAALGTPHGLVRGPAELASGDPNRVVVLSAAQLAGPAPATTRVGSRGGDSVHQLAGLVDVYTRIPGATAAGTGIVLSSDGEVATNKHVVADASSIVATDPSTGRTYTAVLLGADARRDIAVIRLLGTPDLAVAPLGDSDDVQVGDRVEAVGNAGGRGGAPTVTTGQVTGLRQSVIAQDGYTHQQRKLHGMIKIDAEVQAGDSGGPLLERGEVIGMDTAGGTAGFAIPINTVLATAHRLGSPDPDASESGTRRLTAEDRPVSLPPLLAVG